VKAEAAATPAGMRYRLLFRNRALTLLWGGEAVSVGGDTFFALAVMWVVYAESGSALQTALIQVVWHLSSVVFGPLAGALADRWDRKQVMVVTNVLAAATAAALAGAMVVYGRLPVPAAMLAAFFLRSLATFLTPARASLMPDVVGRDLLATATGLYATLREAASLLGNAVAGTVIAVLGAVWAVVIDALSFLVAAVCIALAPLPTRPMLPSSDATRISLARDLRDGWRVISAHPVLRTTVWLNTLTNVTSFLGPLYPALVSQRLHADAAPWGP